MEAITGKTGTTILPISIEEQMAASDRAKEALVRSEGLWNQEVLTRLILRRVEVLKKDRNALTFLEFIYDEIEPEVLKAS